MKDIKQIKYEITEIITEQLQYLNRILERLENEGITESCVQHTYNNTLLRIEQNGVSLIKCTDIMRRHLEKEVGHGLKPCSENKRTGKYWNEMARLAG